MVVLTALLSFLCMVASFGIEKALKGYFALFLLLETGHDGHVRRARLLPLLRLLGAHAAADVLPDRHLGRPAARVRGDQVLPLHAARLGADAGRDALPLLHARRRTRSTSRSSARLVADKIPLIGAAAAVGRRSSSASPSRSRRSRSTPGCPTRTSRRRPPSRSSWPACCSRWARTASCGSTTASCPRRPSPSSGTGAAWPFWVLAALGTLEHHLRRALRDGAAGPEEAGRVLLDQPHGLRDARHGGVHRRRASTARCSRCSTTARSPRCSSSWSA